MPKGVPNKIYSGQFKVKVVDTMYAEHLSCPEEARRFSIQGGESHAKTSDFSCFGFTHSSHGKKQEPPPRPGRQVQDRFYFFWP